VSVTQTLFDYMEPAPNSQYVSTFCVVYFVVLIGLLNRAVVRNLYSVFEMCKIRTLCCF